MKASADDSAPELTRHLGISSADPEAFDPDTGSVAGDDAKS